MGKSLKPFSLTVVPHNEQRYETCGDYFERSGNTIFKISCLKNWKYELLIGVHEIIEKHLCDALGITEQEITAFDLMFEEERKAGKWVNDEEPGNDPRAPYQKAHQFATKIEKLYAIELGVDWDVYDKAVNSLHQTHEQS